MDNQDVPQRLVVSGVYELPFGKGRHFAAGMPAIANALFGGWSVGSILVESNGRPYNVSVSGNPANSGTFDSINRPNVIGDPCSGTRTVERDFNTDAFAPNQQFQIGNAGRNILRQRSFFNWDFSSLKNFQIQEKSGSSSVLRRFTLQIRQGSARPAAHSAQPRSDASPAPIRLGTCSSA